MRRLNKWGLRVEYLTGQTHTYRYPTRDAQRKGKKTIQRIAKVPYTIKEVR